MKEKLRRKCVSCQKRLHKNNLLRVCRLKNRKTEFDREKTLIGRGAYVCRDETCIQKAIQTRAFNRSLKTEINPKVYEEMKKSVEE